MPKFEITTQVTFENKYIVTARTLDDAIQVVMNECNPPHFMQKDLGEKVIASERCEDDDDSFQRLRRLGYI